VIGWDIICQNWIKIRPSWLFSDCRLSFDGTVVSDVSCVRNLGVFFDKTLSIERFDATWCKSTCLEVQLQDTPGCQLHSSGNPYHAVDIFHQSVSKTDNKVWGLTRILVTHRISGAYHKKKQIQSQYPEFYKIRPSWLFSDCRLSFDGTVVSDVSCVRNLGVFFDKTLSIEKQVSATSKLCFYQIRNIWRIRTYITDDACKTLVNN
jgi:hypothetical protein